MTDATTPAPVADNVAPAPIAEAAPATTSQASWRDALPEDIRGHASLSKFETQEGLAKSYLNLEKMLGGEKIPVPKEGDAEGWQRYLKAGGLPEKPDDYGFTKPETLPEGFQYDEALDKRLAGMMHKANVLPSQAKALREELMALVAEGAQENLNTANAQKAAKDLEVQRGTEALKQEWGQAFEQRGKVAGAAINKFLSPETIAAMDAAGLANNPAIVRDMYNLGTKLAGEKELIGALETSQSPADLDSAIADYRSKHGAAMMDKNHPDHRVRVAEFTKLYERRFPQQAS